MSDEEGLSLEDVGAEGEDLVPAGRKAGFLPSFLIRILKWVAIGLGFVILGVTTTVVTVRLFTQGREGEDVRAISRTDMTAKPMPLGYDDTIEEIRGVTADNPPAIFTTRVSIGYKPGNPKLAIELAARKRQIQNLILLSLSTRTKDELGPEHYQALQVQLRNQINGYLREGQIEEVLFREFVVVQ